MGRTASSYLLLFLIGSSFLADVHGHLIGKDKKMDHKDHDDDHRNYEHHDHHKENPEKHHDDDLKNDEHHDHHKKKNHKNHDDDHKNEEHHDHHKKNQEKHHGHEDNENVKEQTKHEFLEILKELKEKLLKNCGEDDSGKGEHHSHRKDEDKHEGQHSRRGREDEEAHNNRSGEDEDDHKSATYVHHHYHYSDGITKTSSTHIGHSSDHRHKDNHHDRDNNRSTHDEHVFHNDRHGYHYIDHGSNNGKHSDHESHHSNHGKHSDHGSHLGNHGKPNDHGSHHDNHVKHSDHGSYGHDSHDLYGNDNHGHEYGGIRNDHGDYKSKVVYNEQWKSKPQDRGNSNGVHVHHYYGVNKADRLRETHHRDSYAGTTYPQEPHSDGSARQNTLTGPVRESTHYVRREDSWRPQPQNHDGAPKDYPHYYGQESQVVNRRYQKNDQSYVTDVTYHIPENTQPQHHQVIQRETGNQPNTYHNPVAHVCHHHNHVLRVEDQNIPNQQPRIETSCSNSSYPAHQPVHNLPMDITALLNIPAPSPSSCVSIEEPPQTPVRHEPRAPQPPCNKPKEEKPVSYMICMQKTLETQCDPPRIDPPRVEPSCPPLQRDPCINSYQLQPLNYYRNPY